jgi:hypothetical protein
MLFKGGFKVFRLRGLRHLGKGTQDFSLREVDVLEGFVGLAYKHMP